MKWVTPHPFEGDPQIPVKILKVKPGIKERGLILSDFVHAVETHWIFGRTKPCIGIENGCEGCGAGAAFRRKGYVAVFLPGSKTCWLLEITPKAFDSNLALCAASGLRGMNFVAYRHGKSDQSALVVELENSLTKPENVPPEPDVKAILKRIWFGRERRKPNPNEKE